MVKRWKPKPDPKIPKDGSCAVCGKQRPDTAVSHDDPFCSAGCARYFHAVDAISPVVAKEKK